MVIVMITKVVTDVTNLPKVEWPPHINTTRQTAPLQKCQIARGLELMFVSVETSSMASKDTP